MFDEQKGISLQKFYRDFGFYESIPWFLLIFFNQDPKVILNIYLILHRLCCPCCHGRGRRSRRAWGTWWTRSPARQPSWTFTAWSSSVGRFSYRFSQIFCRPVALLKGHYTYYLGTNGWHTLSYHWQIVGLYRKWKRVSPVLSFSVMYLLVFLFLNKSVLWMTEQKIY